MRCWKEYLDDLSNVIWFLKRVMKIEVIDINEIQTANNKSKCAVWKGGWC